jgi:hypothetical protein
MDKLDLVLWIFAFVCFLIAGIFGNRIPPRIDLIAIGLAAGAFTFITG